MPNYWTASGRRNGRTADGLLPGHKKSMKYFCVQPPNIFHSQEFDIPVTDVDIMTAADDEFEWKGQDCLTVRSCQFRHPLGYRPQHILQLDPPSAITSLAINTDWGLVAAGGLLLVGGMAGQLMVCSLDIKRV